MMYTDCLGGRPPVKTSTLAEICTLTSAF